MKALTLQSVDAKTFIEGGGMPWLDVDSSGRSEGPQVSPTHQEKVPIRLETGDLR